MHCKSKQFLKWVLTLICVCFTSGEIYSHEGSEEGKFLQTAVSGTVISQSDGLPLPGVTVQVKNTGIGVVTDFDGNYEIEVPTMDAVLVFSYMGFQTLEVTINDRNTIDVELEDDLGQLDEIVVVGYGSAKRATLTGSISEVEAEELQRSPQPNLSNSISGRIPGVIASNRSGEPGYDDSSISIRGLATTGNNDVLVVVDGVPGQIGGLSRLSPEDIESFTVLKDASAAIYGSRAANGVILITTKKGRNMAPEISYKIDVGFASPTRLPDLADAATYAGIRNEISYYNNPNDGLNQVYSNDEINLFRDGSDPVNYPNTNWPELGLQNTTIQTQQNLNVRGGSDRARYFLSLGKISQDGIYVNGANKYDQYSVRSNVDVDITDRLQVGLALNGRKEDRQFPTTGAGEIFRSLYRAYPTSPGIFPNGNPSTGIELSNPLIRATEAGGLNNNPGYIFNGILRGRYDLGFLDGMSIDGFYSVDESSNRIRNFVTPYTLYEFRNDEYIPRVVGGGPDQQGALYEEHFNQSKTVANIKLNYVQRLGDHNVDAFIGYEQSEDNSHTLGASRIHFPTTETPELSQGGAAAADYGNYGSSYNFTRLSYLSRVAYNFQEKYLAEFQARVDGSSIFPEGNRYGFFPSASVGYRISEEQWFSERVPFFNDLKFRASHGKLGNDNVGQFQFFNNYTFNNRYVIGDEVTTGIDLTRLANPNITWEEAIKTDIAINARFLDNFNAEFIYFQQDRSNILTTRNASIPGTTGIVNPYASDPLVPSENIGSVESNGIEAVLGYDYSGEEISFGFSGNFTYAKNEVIFMDEAPGLPEYQRQTGRPMNTYLLYKTLGIFRSEEDLEQYPHVPGAQPGDLIYADINDDGVIDADDRYRTDYGNIPQITFGLNLHAEWRNFDFSALFSGQTNVSQYVLPESGTVGNYYSSWADNRWSPENPGGTYPRVSERASSAVSGGLFRNDFWLDDASFVRLKNIQIGYSLPVSLIERFSVSNARIYASGFNVFTWTGVKDYDPEGASESGQFYPQQRIINLGLNIQI